jgi:hypothetical protein
MHRRSKQAHRVAAEALTSEMSVIVLCWPSRVAQRWRGPRRTPAEALSAPMVPCAAGPSRRRRRSCLTAVEAAPA